MIIEETTAYAYKLKYIEDVSFNRIRAFAQSFVNELPQELVDDIYEQLNRGLDLLQNEPQMLVYLYSFGNMHQAKLNRAFEQLPDAFLQQPEIRIVDYGCGQAIGTMCYADYLAERHLSQTIKSVTLIEPSEICLKRAALHVSQFFPDAEIHTICKPFDDLTDDDIANPDDIPTLHILSNVLDIQEFDLEDFATLIDNNLSNYNQFVCVGPYFNYSDKDERMPRFAELLNGDVTYSKIFEKGELCDGKTWTAQIICYSVEKCLSTKVTIKEIEKGIEDECGVVYSQDGKRLLKCKNMKLVNYKVKLGTQVICNSAFWHSSIQQISIPDSVIDIGDAVFYYCQSLQQIEIINNPKFVVTNNLLIDISQRKLILYFGNEKNISIPNTVNSIAPYAFSWNRFLQKVTIPNTVKTIGQAAFLESTLQQISIPDSVTDIGKDAFSCTYLKQIIIPNSITKIKEGTFWQCWLEQITIPNSVKEIEEKAFFDCSSLWKINIPDSVTTIGKSAFSFCRALKEITIPHSVSYIGSGVFSGCESLRQIKINDNPRFITTKEMLIDIRNKKLLLYYGNEQHITIPYSINTIGEATFCECYSLLQITIPDTVTTIEESVFLGCKSLQIVTIPHSVSHIGNGAFSMCDSLQQIIIPKGSAVKFKKILDKELWNKLVEQ